MVARWVLLVAGACGVSAFAQTFTVGSGAPSTAITQDFQTAYARGTFSKLAGAPLENVTSWGSAGLIQRFPAVSSTTTIYALVKPDTTATANVVQMLATMYAYYTTVTVAAAGYPTADTANCPAVKNAGSGNTCTWQPFTSDYALFVYTKAVGTTTTFATNDPFYTVWSTLGGISTLGPAISAQTKIASPYQTAATKQTFDQSAIYNIASGPLAGATLGVRQPFYAVYLANSADAGSMGLPVSAETTLASGVIQQPFERGAIEHNPSTGATVADPPVAIAAVSPGGNAEINPGGTLAVEAILQAFNGAPIDQRPLAWTTSNSKVVQIQGSGMTVTLKGYGFGTATIGFSVEGVTATALTVSVMPVPCCQIGDGSPNDTVRQAFEDAATRNKLVVQLPAAAGVVRVGRGYVQQLLSAGGTNLPYLIAVADSTDAGYLVDGAMLAQYQQLGGPTGPLGYPVSDITRGGGQFFEGGALAGVPLQLVTGGILSKWKALGYETGAAGPPAASAAAFQTFRGTAGHAQSFAGGQILAAELGPLAGSAFFVTGAMLTRYAASGGPGGILGSPTGDATVTNGIYTQYFEGGYINYTPGASEALEFDSLRQPRIVVSPGSPPAGSTVHLVAGGFNNGVSVRVSQTGQPDFIATAPNGEYAWDVWLPTSTPDGTTVTVQAADTGSGAKAQGSYTVHSVVASTVTISVASGDQQSGAPGAALALPLVVAVRDLDGNPLPGQTVTFAASPGTQVVPGTAVTGTDGSASTTVRLPLAEGVVLITGQAGQQVATFSARSAAFSLTNFPLLSQSAAGTLGNGPDSIANKGALVTAAASILRYHQLRGELPQPNGLADPAGLNQFLESLCFADSPGNQICDGFISLGQSSEQTVNLWRLGAFAGNNLTVQVEPVTLDAVRDLVVAGSPVLLALSLSGLGSHFVVATGIGADGSLFIADPNPVFAQTNLNGYLTGFAAGGQTVLGTLAGAVRLFPQAPVVPGFLAAADAPAAIASLGTQCGQALQIPGAAAVAGVTPATAPGTLTFQACDGSAALYQLDIGGQGTFDATLTDLSGNGGRTVLTGAAAPSSWQIVGSGQQWTVSPLTTVIAGPVVNAASYTDQLAPGCLISIFGADLGSAASPPKVQVGGQSAVVVAATSQQVNAQIPFAAPVGTAQLSLSTPNGSVQQTIAIGAVAPAIFSLAPGQAAITNQDGTLNTPTNPAGRGNSIVIYATGLGAVSGSGATLAAVSFVIGGVAIPAASAGLSPGVTGLYAAKVLLPSTLPPGLSLGAYLKQGNVVSNTVTVAIQ